ncbi:MAG: hypothetical protein HYY25_07915 [Candidatus Wallbacteria bacterium]|nr:hypothetical protein [Candidatus Wallbacteria bacterium]
MRVSRVQPVAPREEWEASGRWALALFAAFDLALFLPVLMAGADCGLGVADGDSPRMFVPWRQFARQSLLAGEVPIWNPHLMAGLPYLASLQAAIFYPPNALYLLPLGLAMSLTRFLHVLLGQLGAWALAREAGARGAGPLVAGLAFGLSAQTTYRIFGGHACQLDATAWVPWVLLGVLCSIRRPAPLTVARTIAASALCLLAGYPQVFYIAWFCASIVVTVAAVGDARRLRLLGRFAALTAAVALSTAVLAAAALLPALELLKDSSRAGFDPRFASLVSLAPENLLTLLAPRALGDDATAPYWGQSFAPESIFYVGIATLVLAWRAIRLLERPRVLPWLVLAEVALVMALGARTPLFLPIARTLPGMSMFRGPAKFMLGFSLAAAMLAALGAATVGAAGETRRRRPRRLGWLAVLLVLASLLALHSGAGAEAFTPWLDRYLHSGERYTPMPDATVQSTRETMRFAATDILRSLFMLALTAAPMAAASAGKLSRKSAGLLLALLLGVDLVTLGIPCMKTFPLQRCALPAQLTQLIGRQPGGPWRVSLWDRIDQNRVMPAGLESLDGYEAILPRTTADFYDAMERRPAETRLPERMTEPRPETRILNQRFYVYRAGGLDSKAPLRLVGRVGDLELWEDPLARPRAFLTADYRVLPDRASVLERVRAGELGPGSPPLLEEQPGFATSEGAGSPGSARFLARRPLGSVLTTDATTRCLLVVTDALYPGWRACVDGAPARILRAWGLVRAVEVPAGRHQVDFRFDPKTVVAGIGLSAAGWLLLLAAVALARRRRHADGPDETPDGGV